MKCLTAVIIVSLLACTASAQQQVEKSFAVGDLAYLESSEPCGWLCFDRPVSSERDGSRCYIPSKPGTFKVAALSKTSVGEVLAYFTVTVGGSVDPAPVDPVNPPGPAPAPDVVPDALGLGKLAYDHARSANQPAIAASLSGVWLGAGDTLRKRSTAGVEISVADMREAQQFIERRFVEICGTSQAWLSWRSAVHGKINQLQDSSQGWTGDDWIAACDEIGKALGAVR